MWRNKPANRRISSCFPPKRTAQFPSRVEGRGTMKCGYEVTTTLESAPLFAHSYFELIFLDLHCHHSGPSHLCPSCRPKQLLPAHFSYRGQRWEGLGGQKGPEMPWWWWWREGGKWCHNRCGKDRSFSPACQQWLGQSPMALEMSREGNKQVPTYFPAA